jgi:hypothetical protein
VRSLFDIRDRRWMVALVIATVACGGGSGDEQSPGSEAASGAMSTEPGGLVGADSLVLVANVRAAPLHLLPADWADLFHFRFADEVLTLSPEVSPEVREFMEGVLQSEARRVGTVDAGFDWLRRFDTQVLGYETEADDVRWRLRQGHAWFALLPSSEVGPLLEREGFRVVPLESGFHPSRWEVGPGPASRPDAGGADSGDTSRGEGADVTGEGIVEAPDPPADWLVTWAAEVRGRG